jgi:hypothetical protein
VKGIKKVNMINVLYIFVWNRTKHVIVLSNGGGIRDKIVE